MKKTIFVLLLIAAILSGCGKRPEEMQALMKNHLSQRGYEVISYEGNVAEYKLTPLKLTEQPYMAQWGVQKVDPEPYLGKTIRLEKFIIKNHPLDNWELRDKDGEVIAEGEGKTQVLLFMVEQKVIGGVSYPITQKIVLGQQPWSLEGKTLEEVQGVSFQKWYEEWMAKYRKEED